MRTRAVLPLLALALAAPLSACGTGAGSSEPTVVASFYPLEFVTRQLAGDHLRITDLTTPGAEPHDLELKPKQVGQVASADLVVYESKLQPSVDEAVDQNAGNRSLDVAPVVDLEDGNPHFWLDPLRLSKAATAIEKRLAKIDPAHAKEYAANLTTLQGTLEGIDQQFTAGLKSCERNVIVTSHDAFGYWARYGLKSEPIAGLSPDAEPSAQHLEQLRSLIEKDHVTTVFSETLASPKMAEVLSHDLGVSTAVLDPIEGVAKGSSADYFSLMRANLAALQRANGCKVSP